MFDALHQAIERMHRSLEVMPACVRSHAA